MRRRVLTALVAVAMSAAMLPGLAAAGGNSVNAKNCQANYTGFKNRGQCTSYHAKLQAQLRAQTRGVPPGHGPLRV